MRWLKWLSGQINSGHFLAEVWRSVTVPRHVGDDERLARYCDKKAIKTKIKPSVFYSGQLPLEISVDRVRYSNPNERVRRESTATKPKAFVTLLAGEVRARVTVATVVSDMPPPEHAEIVLGIATEAVLTREALKMDANQWAEFTQICEEL